MRKWLLAGASALALSVAAGGAANATVFSYTGAVASFTAATSGEYQIVAAGAQGGKSDGAVGGAGARLGGDIYLAAGTTLNVVVGQAGLTITAHSTPAGAGVAALFTGPLARRFWWLPAAVAARETPITVARPGPAPAVARVVA